MPTGRTAAEAMLPPPALPRPWTAKRVAGYAIVAIWLAFFVGLAIYLYNAWRIDRQAFCAELQVRELLLLNDFSAMALGMTCLQDDEYVTVCPGVAQPWRPAVVIGAGTGLGVGTLLSLPDGSWHALPGEGGHVDLPVGSNREALIWQALHRQLGHVSAEAGALSGNGLLALYRATCAVDGQPASLQSAAQVTRAAGGGGGGGGQRPQVQQSNDEPWSTPGSNNGGGNSGADAWSTPGSYGDDTPF